MMHLPDLVTLLAVMVFFGCMIAVGRARRRYGIIAPATSGNPDFERVFRVQMNTLEALAMFLPALWIATHYYADPALTGGLGLVWVVARIWYAVAYASAAQKRGMGFGLGMLATLLLWAIALWGVVRAMIAG